MNLMKNLRRPLQPIPDFVREALEGRGLIAAYNNRPPYQRNDCLGWINRAKQEKTQLKRLNQMLDELAAGDSYMGMRYKAKQL